VLSVKYGSRIELLQELVRQAVFDEIGGKSTLAKVVHEEEMEAQDACWKPRQNKRDLT